MEINLENAFFIVIKLSIGRYVANFDDVLTQRGHAFIERQANNALKKPLLTTLIFSCILMMLISAVLMSIITTAAVLCAVVVIIIIEGFVLGAIMAIAAALTFSIFGGAIIIFGSFSTCKQKL